jgi:hypothetical protein
MMRNQAALVPSIAAYVRKEQVKPWKTAVNTSVIPDDIQIQYLQDTKQSVNYVALNWREWKQCNEKPWAE